MKMSIAQRIREKMTEVGTNNKALAREAGLNETYIRDVLEGRSRNPTQSRLDKVFDALERLGGQPDVAAQPDKAVATRSSFPMGARWFTAARWACWGDDMEKAISRLDLAADLVARIELGLDLPDDGTTIRYHLVTGFPVRWFLDGCWDGIPSALAGRVAVFDPGLAPPAPREAR